MLFEFRQALFGLGQRDAHMLAQLDERCVAIFAKGGNELFRLSHDVAKLFGERRTLGGCALHHAVSTSSMPRIRASRDDRSRIVMFVSTVTTNGPQREPGARRRPPVAALPTRVF